MNPKHRRVANEGSPAPPSRFFETVLRDIVVDAAAVGQGMSGRGVLLVRYDSVGITWVYKPVAECGEEVSEWMELEGLLSLYDPTREVLVGLLGDGFFRLPLLHR